MSISDDAPQKLSRLIIGLNSTDLEITVFDAYDRLVYLRENPRYWPRVLDLKLPPGLYTVRSTRGGAIAEKVIRLREAKNQIVVAPVPQIFSAAPLTQASNSHEQYSWSALIMSREETAPPLGNGASLFLFIRAAGRSADKEQDLKAGLSLRNASGVTVSNFEPEDVKGDIERDNNGEMTSWLAYHVRVAAGVYYLHYEGEIAREMPLHLFEGWQSQVFLLHHEHLLFEEMRVFMAPQEQGFEPDDIVAEVVDQGIAGLHNNMNLLPNELPYFSHYDGFQNPMLGLIGAHILLRDPDIEQHTFIRILFKLESLIPDSADVQALWLMVAHRFGGKISQKPFRYAPMFRAGLEAVLKAAASHPEILPENGEIERASMQLYADSPWSSWRPAANRPDPRAVNYSLETLNTDTELDWVQQALLDVFDRAIRIKTKYPETESELNVADVVLDLHLPRRIVENAWQNLGRLGPDQIARLEAEWPDFAKLRPRIIRARRYLAHMEIVAKMINSTDPTIFPEK